jgi:hypothetical protein
MKTLAILLLLTAAASAQQTNNATVNIIGNNQNVIINQSGSGHTANLSLYGNDIPVSVTQSGPTSQSFSLSHTCYSNCSSSPIVVNQY